MKLLICGIAIISLVVTCANGDNPIRLRDGPYITQPEEGHHSSLGVVKGVRNCGGPGKVIEWRIDGCHNEEGACRLEATGQKAPTEYEFVPSQDINSLGIRFVIIEDNTIISVYERPIESSEVMAGQVYIVNSAATLSERLKGRKITTQYILYQVDDEDNETEACLEADFEFY